MKEVELLGHGSVTFSQDAGGLTVDIPGEHSNSIAPVMRITFDDELQSVSELLAQAIEETEAVCAALEQECSDINTGKHSTTALAALKEALAQAKAADPADEDAASAALNSLREAYQDFMSKGVNEGGVFNRTVDENLTADVLIEAENFSGTLGGRYGKLDNWISENYSIDKGSEGVRNGLDNYGNKRGISIGVWDDRGANKGDISNARIYRKVTMPAGIWTRASTTSVQPTTRSTAATTKPGSLSHASCSPRTTFPRRVWPAIRSTPPKRAASSTDCMWKSKRPGITFWDGRPT